tara:strand:+ start:1611 stop:1886 length:276 start_codon:yes stop_codon:yes gene_type:complete
LIGRPTPLSSSTPDATNFDFGPARRVSIDHSFFSSFFAIMTGLTELNCGRAMTTAGAACGSVKPEAAAARKAMVGQEGRRQDHARRDSRHK